MQITCPHCNYSKQIDPSMLPPATTRATCPKCQSKFDLRGTKPSTAHEPQVEQQDVADLPQQPQTTRPDRQIEVNALPKAGFWLRVVATLIDTFLVFCMQFVLGLLLALTGFATTGSSGEIGGVVMLFGYIIGFTYYIVFTGHGGQTPGKMALRIKVIHRDGGDIGYSRAAFREVIGKFISGLIFCIGYLMVAFDKQKKGLHDRMADTYVIKL